jgi:putative spermidine/putrescine transport system substrate-binding protein
MGGRDVAGCDPRNSRKTGDKSVARKLTGIAALAIAFMSALTLASAPSRADDSKTAYLQSYGGTIQALLQQLGVADRFHADTGYTITLVPKVTGDEIIGTAIAQAANPHIDLVFVDEAIWMRGLQRNIFAPLDPKDFPNFSKMYPIAFVKKSGQIYGVAAYADILGILYQPEIFKKKGWAPPTAWKDLFRPEFKGYLALPTVGDYGYFLAVQLARMNGGSEQNIMAGFDAMKRLAPGTTWTETFTQVAQLFSRGDAALAVQGIGLAKKLRAQGVPVVAARPDPLYFSPTVMGIMKNAPDAKAAKVFMNWFLGKFALTKAAMEYGHTPLNKEVQFSPADVEALGLVQGEAAISHLAVINFDYVSQHLADWEQEFRAEIAPLSK